jgi:formate dehydrogenase beta subunit
MTTRDSKFLPDLLNYKEKCKYIYSDKKERKEKSVTEQVYKVIIPDAEYYRKMIKCQEACPVYTDSRGYVTAVARGDLDLGYEIAHDPNPLSTICGRICGAPCEIACRRRVIGPDLEPVAIRPLKRVLTERFGPESIRRLPQTPPTTSPYVSLMQEGSLFNNGFLLPGRPNLPGEGAPLLFNQVRWSQQTLRDLASIPNRVHGRVAVVGAGPSGLTVAHDLSLLGHTVTIFEAGPKTGGMMRYGVPVYRIDQEAMDLEIDSIINLGVTVHFNTRIGEKITLSELRNQYDAVFLGMGLIEGRKLEIEGSELDGVITAIDLLLNYNLGYKVQLGKRVIVVGGGDVAMDAARTALRLGQITPVQVHALDQQANLGDEESEAMHTALDVARTALRLGVADVRMISLESLEELPASRFELEEALEEGITLMPRLGPNRIIGNQGKTTGLEVIEVASVFDESGRFNPRFKLGTARILECDTVILAIGQRANLDALGGAPDIVISERGLIQINPQTLQTTAKDVFAGGDAAYGPRLIISAVRDGHIAALGIEQFLQNRPVKSEMRTEWTDLTDRQIMFPDWTKRSHHKVPALAVDRRTGISVIELGYDLNEAANEGFRCLECSLNTIFDGSKCILCNGCVDVCPWDCLKIVSIGQIESTANLEAVIERQFGEPLAAIRKERPYEAAAMIKDDEACTRCALCAKRCPTGAITMEAFRFQESLGYDIEQE